MNIELSKRILDLRVKLNVTQHELGKILGVSWVTVNRWENGHYSPTKLVKVRLEQLLKKHKI